MNPRVHIVIVYIDKYDVQAYKHSNTLSAFVNGKLMEAAKDQLPKPPFRRKWEVLEGDDIEMHDGLGGYDPRGGQTISASLAFTEVEDLKFHKKYVKASRRRWHSYTGRKR